jgi:DNA processing protein
MDDRSVRVIDDRSPEYAAGFRLVVPVVEAVYAQGILICGDDTPGPRIGIVGARKASAYGLARARNLASELAERGCVVVSGMAEGIDASAHHGALEAGGRSIGVLGCGLDIVYPRVNASLYQRMRAAGTLLSEYPPGSPPRREYFPARNRIISALSDALIVVEGRLRSGAMITADFSLELGRDVMAVPGRSGDPLAEAPLSLIKDGARIVETADDVFEALGLDVAARQRPPRLPKLEGDEAVVYAALRGSARNIDEIIGITRLPTHVVSSILVILELKRHVLRDLAGNYHISS